ncbi:PAAR domain-containing protein [Burkholderia cenocepacia]|uniref:PAAR domain-containing protein n=1 Tax=Burkholderia cenocepacia TaxID=95486 RepID=UPI000F5638BA|nr:PAAR domain-containing protein [Burkholderia cenocepacia]MBR8309406.1 PAAR domain-containing protein [Burkholderia cenocepacia]MCA7963544.1 PAAR domain-containing protein [Burkholderia cenocepacia]MCF1370135.1 PAAR domain-containing protein [Burkholderia cenocepacia]MCF1385834.1 PAAR domain-containing protein [Burkholderia cenocepacia]MDR8029610.1 PAAR domain-containing protein [Burkholderia cenocepacia]
MPAFVATLGTLTTHGGEVTLASAGVAINGRLAACVGDSISCPLHGPGVITNGGFGTINGRQIAHHGSGTSCDATLMVSGSAPTV